MIQKLRGLLKKVTFYGRGGKTRHASLNNEMASKRSAPQELAIWFQKRRRSIIKYSVIPICVISLAFIMYKVIPEGKETDTEPQKFLATALKNIEGVSIFAAVILYFMERGDRKQRKHYEAWQVVDAAHRIKVSRARFQALQDLHEDGVSLSRLELSQADLSSILLSGANLSRTNLIDANLKGANLKGANLSRANLIDANLIDANLRGAFLSDADLENANLREADLTPEQVKQAKNWEKAKYSEEFRAKLGLPPEPAENQGE